MEVAFKPLHPEEALHYFRSKGLAPVNDRYDFRDIWRGQHAVSFVVAKAMRDDVLAALRAGVDKALAEGQTLAQFQAEMEPRLRAMGWWGRSVMRDPETGEIKEVQLGSMHRLRVIFDTNMRTALATGRWARIQRTKKSYPYLGYRQIDRRTKRPEHERFDGGVWPVDDPIWLRIYPPNGWFCGCSVVQITQGEINRGDYKLSPPLDLDEVPWENTRTGKVEQIPDGVHPGFDVNPGALWLDMERRMEGLEGHPNLPQLQALAVKLRFELMRDMREQGAFVRPDGDVHLHLMAADGKKGALDLPPPAAPLPTGMDFIHSHPSETNLSPSDVQTLFDYQLKTMTAVTRGGNVFSIASGPKPYITAKERPAFAALYFEFKNELRSLPHDLGSDVLNEVFLRSLEQREIISYYSYSTGQYRDRIELLEPFIQRMLDRWPK